MAKASASTSARLVATINARYYPVEGIADAYCLNGKLPSKRELRSVNTTLDRDSKGSFVALFGYSSDGRSPVAGWYETFKRLADQVDSGRGDIDNDINDLAETAMDVTGHIRLGDGSSREPYFSGVIIRNGEMAAVSVGDSLAFVYRYEALYPLTSSMKGLEPTDLYGDRIEGFDDFVAGEAGTIRYSNIAQIEEGDRLILCNGEVFDSVGQGQMMRYLQEAEDSLDAANLLLTAAASQMPGTPMQVAVIDVVSIREDEPSSSRFSLGRFATQAMEPVVEPVAQEKPEMDFARTQRYQRQDMVDTIKPMPSAVEEEKPTKPTKPTSFEDEWSQDFSVESERKPPFAFSEPTDSFAADEDSIFAPPYRSFVEEPESVRRQPLDDDGLVDIPAYKDYKEESDLPVFAYGSEAQRRRSAQSAQYDDYGQEEAWDVDDGFDDDRAYDPYSDDDYDELGYERKPRPSDRTRRIVFYIILIAIIVVSIVALIKLLAGGGGKTPPSKETTTTTQAAPIVVPSTTTAPVPSVTTTTPPSADASGDTIYTVKKGDNIWHICRAHYGRVNETLCNRLARYNGMKDMSQNIYPGQDLKLPPIQKLQEMED